MNLNSSRIWEKSLSMSISFTKNIPSFFLFKWKSEWEIGRKAFIHFLSLQLSKLHLLTLECAISNWNLQWTLLRIYVIFSYGQSLLIILLSNSTFISTTQHFFYQGKYKYSILLGSGPEWLKDQAQLLTHSRHARNFSIPPKKIIFEIMWALFEIILFIHFCLPK